MFFLMNNLPTKSRVSILTRFESSRGGIKPTILNWVLYGTFFGEILTLFQHGHSNLFVTYSSSNKRIDFSTNFLGTTSIVVEVERFS